tara:strand:- start:2649 stop:2891 length:243 start_codon:yes stop_codon:yes gene_type:complete
MVSKSKSIRFNDFLEALMGLQDMMKNENLIRVANSPDEDWNLILSLEITPSKFILKSEETIIEFDADSKKSARIKKRKRK